MAKLFGFLVIACALTWSNIQAEQRERMRATRDLGPDLWTHNAYVKDIQSVVRDLNISNCWICMHMPGRRGAGISLHAVPDNLSQAKMTNESGRNVTAVIEISLWEEAKVCVNITTGTRPLGKYKKCKRIIPFLPGSESFSNHSTSPLRKRNDIAWGEYQALVFLEKAFNWTLQQNGQAFGMPSEFWFLCGKAYREIPQNCTGICTVGLLLPTVYKIQELPKVRLRNKREVENQLTRSHLGGSWEVQTSRPLMPPLGMAMNYRDLYILNNWTVIMFNNTIKGMKLIDQGLSKVRTIALQNRYALDIVLAAKGGICALIQSHCCMYIHDNGPNITMTAKAMEEMVRTNPLRGDRT